MGCRSATENGTAAMGKRSAHLEASLVWLVATEAPVKMTVYDVEGSWTDCWRTYMPFIVTVMQQFSRYPEDTDRLLDRYALDNIRTLL